MKPQLTRKINGEWDFTSLAGTLRGTGIVCQDCGKIVQETWHTEGVNRCGECHRGQRSIENKCWVGKRRVG